VWRSGYETAAYHVSAAFAKGTLLYWTAAQTEASSAPLLCAVPCLLCLASRTHGATDSRDTSRPFQPHFTIVSIRPCQRSWWADMSRQRGQRRINGHKSRRAMTVLCRRGIARFCGRRPKGTAGPAWYSWRESDAVCPSGCETDGPMIERGGLRSRTLNRQVGPGKTS